MDPTGRDLDHKQHIQPRSKIVVTVKKSTAGTPLA
jgi:hypothetical protein